MSKVFSYGTLWRSDVQIKEFGITFSVDNNLDYISGWDILKIKMYDEIFSIAIEGESIISGAIIEVPDHFMKNIDRYEGREYKRIKVTTLTGNNCYMYVKR